MQLKALRYLRRVFPYLTKTPNVPRTPDLDVHMGLSPSLATTSEEYKRELKKLIQYIKGGRVKLVNEIEKTCSAPLRNSALKTPPGSATACKICVSCSAKSCLATKSFWILVTTGAAPIKELFGLPKTPARIEGYDISHMSGTNAVASMVVFTNGVSQGAVPEI